MELALPGDGIYEVEKIVGKRRKKGQITYLVKWKGYEEWVLVFYHFSYGVLSA